MKNLYILFLACCFTTISLAQEASPGDMITDRPDATEAPNLIPKNYLQVETGSYYKKYEGEYITEDQYGYNTTLLRYGLLENLELRLGFDIVKKEISGLNMSLGEMKGFESLLLGAKIGVAEENGWLPQIGLIGHLRLPFAASKDLRPEYTGVDFRFAFAHQLSNKSSFSYNLGAEWEGDFPGVAYIYTICYGYDISEKLGFFVEVYGDFHEDFNANHNWDGGFTYLLSNNVQLDILAGTGIGNYQKFYAGGGLSFRLPN